MYYYKECTKEKSVSNSVLVSSSGPGAHDLPSGGPNGYFSVKHVKTVIFSGPRPPGYLDTALRCCEL